MYSSRHYFASNALGNGIPITDVAEWWGTSPSRRRIEPIGT